MKKIAITMGEPGGIGPEVIVKALFCAEIRNYCNPIVIGDIRVMKEAVKLTGLPINISTISHPSESKSDIGKIEVIDIKSPASFKRRGPSIDAGQAVVKYIRKATEFVLKKKVHGIVTAPISKKSLKMAGYTWPGHTELLAELTNTENFAMMFVGERLRVVLATIHVPLKEVSNLINERLILKTIMLAKKGAEMLNIKKPNIAVAGLNPHAGEAGIMGDEETKTIMPAVEKAKKKGVLVSGPYPADTLFSNLYDGKFDIAVCMYHDQGLAPFKMLYFDTGVNITVGLPIIRTSPDHGTAFDIAWQNKANPTSMLEAIKLAARLKL